MAKQKTTPGTRQMVKVVGDLIQQFARQETKNPISVADFLRLLAVFKELDAQRSVKEVRVKWVGREKAA
jgi:hypothetical protein